MPGSKSDVEKKKSYDERLDDLLSSIQGSLEPSTQSKKSKVDTLDTAEDPGTIEDPQDPEMGIELQAFIDVIMD